MQTKRERKENKEIREEVTNIGGEKNMRTISGKDEGGVRREKKMKRETRKLGQEEMDGK